MGEQRPRICGILEEELSLCCKDMRKVIFKPRRLIQGYLGQKETFEDNGVKNPRIRSTTSNIMGRKVDERRGVDKKKRDVVVQIANNR